MLNLSTALKEKGVVLEQGPVGKAAYITRDGYFINLQTNKIQFIGYVSKKDVYHNDFVNYLRYANIIERESQLKDFGLIRLNDGTYITMTEEAFMELPKKKPTEKQFNALLKWLDYLMLNSRKKYVRFGIGVRGEQYEFVNAANQDGMLPEDIIKEIKRMYNETC